jgi:hypothetical protein
LTEQLRTRRVFRHFVLGNMAGTTRHTWMLDADGRRLTVVCEREDSPVVEAGRPDALRWYVVASASFVAVEVPAGQTWAPIYRREELTWIGGMWRSTCTELGEEITFDCRTAKLHVRRPNAYVPSETGSVAPIVWRPTARRTVDGLGCDVGPRGDHLSWYDYPYEYPPPVPPRPMIFFRGVNEGTEGLVHSDALQYVGFREAAPPVPFDPRLTPLVLNPPP